MLFYGRLKNLSGKALATAVVDSLKQVDCIIAVYDLNVCLSLQCLSLQFGKYKGFRFSLFFCSDRTLLAAKVDLLDVIDEMAATFSGGMKRRLSVAISLIGHPLCCYLVRIF